MLTDRLGTQDLAAESRNPILATKASHGKTVLKQQPTAHRYTLDPTLERGHGETRVAVTAAGRRRRGDVLRGDLLLGALLRRCLLCFSSQLKHR